MEVIQPAIKNYQWAETSKIKNICNHFHPEESKEIAELWFGTHHEGHAYINSTGELLQDYIGIPMDFLFKLLSVGKPLSIQVHPDKENASILHETNPQCYPDPNAKPEIAIAISEKAYAFCGIQPIEQIQKQLSLHFSDLFDAYILDQLQQKNDDNNSIIRDCFINIYEMPERKYDILSRRLHRKNHVFRYLEQSFPGDRGCAICVLFLNFISLKKYDAICINPNEIHCYITGNFFECMTTSNNVIRAGLTSKYVDYATFFKIASFKSHHPEYFMIHNDNKTKIFSYTFNPLPLIRVLDTVLEPQQLIDLESFATYIFVVVLQGENVLINNFSVENNTVYVFDLNRFKEKNRIYISNNTNNSLNFSLIVISI